ncbi:MAG: hypothetical protein ACKOFP_05590 [Actinomycetota bacterium]
MSLARRFAAATAVVVALCAMPATAAQADDNALRERAHARVAAIMDDAVDLGLYSRSQDSYVIGAIIPGNTDPKNLPTKVEERTVDAFWAIVAEGAGLSVQQVQARLSYGSTLLRITGGNSEDVRDRLYRWLSRPVVEAQFDGRISAEESTDLRDDIDRAVWRVMAQPGGGRDVVLVPRRD